MNDRERLVELLSENFVEFCHVELIAGNCKISAVTFDADKMADCLIANGVTVQRHGQQFAYRCPECNSSVTDCSKREKPRLIHCPRCGTWMNVEDSNDKI